MKILNNPTTKQLQILLALILFFFIYVYIHADQSKSDTSYLIQFISILYFQVSILSVALLGRYEVKKKDVVVALSIGFVCIGNPYPLQLATFLNVLCVALAYLASTKMGISNKYQMKIISDFRSDDFRTDLKVIFASCGVFVFLAALSNGFRMDIHFELQYLYRALSAGVSEEVIFRFFLYSLVMLISKSNVEINFLIITILVVPFSLYHFVDIGVANGFLSAFLSSFQLYIYALAFTLIALKRNLFSSITVHVLNNILIMILFGTSV